MEQKCILTLVKIDAQKGLIREQNVIGILVVPTFTK